MKSRKELTNEQNALRFKTIKIFPFLGRLSIIIGFLIGLLYYKKTSSPIWILISSIIGIAIYMYFAYRYKCPNCGHILSFSHSILGNDIEKCPNCNKTLNDKIKK